MHDNKVFSPDGVVEILWRFGVLFPKQYLVDVQSRISSIQKLTRCYFMTLEDAVKRAPVLPFLWIM